mmetsp:Transcript_108202/g.191597  ORF Transcript_108202/g.191597 Transcript_108202/m.191597 type:complete len:260 (-) Transcript_108202:89-868(-)
MGQGAGGEIDKKCCLNCSGKAAPDTNVQIIHEDKPPAETKDSARSSSSQKVAAPEKVPAPVTQAAPVQAQAAAPVAPSASPVSQNVSEASETGALLGNALPDKAFATAEPFGTLDYEEMTKKQRQAAKHLVKDFVKTMVKGRQLSAVLTSGQIRTCFCVLNRSLDKLQIRASEKDKQGRTIPLATIAEIIVGSDASGSAASDLETPLDNLSVTLVLDSDECITFRLPDLESRDHLAACLTMFSNQSRDMGKYGDNGKSG